MVRRLRHGAFFLYLFLLSVFQATMASALTVSEFSSLAFVRRALLNPESPSSVLSYWFGVDYEHHDKYKEDLSSGKGVVDRMDKLWWTGGPEFDNLCQPFAPVIVKGRSRLLNWNDSVDGLMAQLILHDQLSRNVFRGKPEAFANDELALEISIKLTDVVLSSNKVHSSSIRGEFYPPYLIFLTVLLMHSEEKDTHVKCLELLEFAKSNSSEQLADFWDYQLEFELSHKNVIDKFGRYPHRNKSKHRESTLEEITWLADTDNLPEWALSQQ